MFAGADEISRDLGRCYRAIATEFDCEFLDTAAVIRSSPVDGIHLDASELPKLGTAVASKSTGDTRMIGHALVRPPGESFVRAISTSGAAIDVALARAQHAEYRQALAAAGVEVEVLPSDERYPDSCFMQDPALVIAGTAIIARPGAASRQGEEDAVSRGVGRAFSAGAHRPARHVGGGRRADPARSGGGGALRAHESRRHRPVGRGDYPTRSVQVFPCWRRRWTATCTCSPR